MMNKYIRPTLRIGLHLHDEFTKICYWLGALSLFVIVCVFAYEVVMRYFFLAPTKWASDSVSFLLLISIFLVVPYVTRIEGNVSVPVLIEILGHDSKVSVFLHRFGFVVGAIVCLCAGVEFFNETGRLFDRGTATLTTVQIPKWTLFIFIAIGMFNAGLCFLRLAFGDRHQTLRGDH